MRILLVSLTFRVAGASLALLRIADLLAAAGHEIGALALDHRGGALRRHYEQRGIAPVTTVRRGDFDLAICNTVASAGFVARIADGCPVIWWLREGETGARALAEHPSWTAAFAASHRIVVQSRHARDAIYSRWLEDLPPGRVVVLPNGIDFPETPVRPPPTERRRVVGLGPVTPRKRIADLIAAVEGLQRDDVELVVVGRNDQMSDDWRAVVARSPQRYRLTGTVPREEACGWIAAADVLAMPSADEGQPSALAEAGFYGTAIAVSDLPMLGEFGWHDGESCLLHKVGDIAALAANIARLLDDPALAARLKAAARLAATAHHGLEPFRARLLALVADAGDPAGPDRLP